MNQTPKTVRELGIMTARDDVLHERLGPISLIMFRDLAESVKLNWLDAVPRN